MNVRRLSALYLLATAICVVLLSSKSLAQKRTIDIIWVGGNPISETDEDKKRELEATPELETLRDQIANSELGQQNTVVLHNYTHRGTLVGDESKKLSDFKRTTSDSIAFAGCFSHGCRALNEHILSQDIPLSAIVHDPVFDMFFGAETQSVIEVNPVLDLLFRAEVIILSETASETALVRLRAPESHGDLVKWSIESKRFLGALVAGAKLGSAGSSGGAGLESKPVEQTSGEAFQALAQKRYYQRGRKP